jgi:HAE1 family hydrophobic/amphiphilic exporter-1
MSIYKSAVNKPITTLMVFVAIIIFGIYSYIKLPIDFYPEMEIPAVSVITSYPGANAADIETNLTKPLEDALSSVPNLKEISSTSQDNLSIITIEYEYGQDLSDATNDIRDRLDRVLGNLPDGVDRPQIIKFNTSMMPILMYSITAKESYAGLDKLIDEQVVNPLNRIDGIGSVAMSGGPKRVIYVETDPQKLDAYNLTIEQIGNAIGMENLNLPAGNVRMGREDYQLRVEGEFKESADMKNIVVGSYGGKTILLKDIAQVRDTIKDVTLVNKVDGQQSMGFYVTKQTGANTVKIAKQVKSELERIKPTLPSDIHFNEIFDSSTFIQNSVNGLAEALMYALIFVVLVVLFFLGRWRATFIIVLTIPVSLISAFIYLQMTGNSLNIISLSSLSIAIGMVVDDAIVVLENITKHIERGSSPREAAIYATNEVWLSVLVTSLVVLAVFLPLTMVGGQMGVLFKQLGFIVSITITVSTVAAISLTPMMSAYLLRFRKKGVDYTTRYDRTVVRLLDKLDDAYAKILKWALHHKKVIIFSALGIFVFSLFLLKFIGSGFLPESDQGMVSAKVELARGTRVEETAKIADKLEEAIKKEVPEAKFISFNAGTDDDGGISSLFNEAGTNIINFNMRLVEKKDRNRTSFEIADVIRQVVAREVEVIDYTVSTSSGMSGQENKVDIEIFGHDFDETNRLAEEIKAKVSVINGARNIQISRKDDKAELQIVFDRQKLAELGLNSTMVSSAVRNRVYGLTASKFRDSGDEYDIIVRFEENYRNSISEIENITLTTPMGAKVKLKEVGEVKELWSPPNIDHKRKERIVTVSVTPFGTDLGTLATSIKAAIKPIEKPQGVIINVGGTYEDQQESMMDLGLLLVLSLILVFIVMASQFESFSKPFIIMTSAMFGFSGVFIALFITGTDLNMIAGLGAILLIGIVTKNGIVLVDFINLLRDRGEELFDAIVEAGRSRLRPVVMTSLTTILGMVPMALSTSDGSEVWQPMGIAVIGGLTFSTIVTLVIVPTVYAVMSRRGERDKQKKVRERFKVLND